MAKRKIIADKTPYLIRSGNILHYTENTTVLSLTKTYIIQRIPLSCYWQKPTLYREYHCPVTDKNLHYTENTTVLLLTKTYIIQRIPLSCHWQSYIIQWIPLSCHSQNLHYTENTTVLLLTKTYIIQRIPLSCHWRTHKKSLKLPKGQSESVYRRTDKTMAKRKCTKGQKTINKTYI